MKDADERIQRKLRAELDDAATSALSYGKWSYFWLMFLTAVTIAASAAAGVLALGFNVDRIIVGSVALIPGIAASILQQYRLASKANFYFGKVAAVQALIREIDYGFPDGPTADDLSRISLDFSALEAGKTSEWQKFVGQDLEAPEVVRPGRGS